MVFLSTIEAVDNIIPMQNCGQEGTEVLTPYENEKVICKAVLQKGSQHVVRM